MSNMVKVYNQTKLSNEVLIDLISRKATSRTLLVHDESSLGQPVSRPIGYAYIANELSIVFDEAPYSSMIFATNLGTEQRPNIRLNF